MEVDDEAGLVSLYRPQTFGDTTTRTRIRLDDITSLAVTDIQWSAPRESSDPHGQPMELVQEYGKLLTAGMLAADLPLIACLERTERPDELRPSAAS